MCIPSARSRLVRKFAAGGAVALAKIVQHKEAPEENPQLLTSTTWAANYAENQL